MDWVTGVIFALVYAGMILGRWPGLSLDRTGIALLGAILVLAFGRTSVELAWQAIDVSTISLLLALMVVSAQLRLGGVYAWITRRIAGVEASPAALLALVIAAAGVLSAVLANDIVCLAMAPLLIEGCARRRLNPMPYLLGLACAANVGSAATLIGNPQNMLIGQVLGLSFAGYLIDGGVPAAIGLALTWAIVALSFRGRWHSDAPAPPVEAPAFDAWQAGKGLAAVAAIVAAFLFSDWPREVVALAAAGVLLTSRRLHSRDMLALVDWQLLVLFAGLFIVNDALARSGWLERSVEAVARAGLDVREPGPLFVVTAVLSNLVSNVPAVMLLLPTAEHPAAGAILALSSTLAGNLLIVGSIANIIVVDQAARLGVSISWRQHARVGVPVTLATLAVAAAWLAWLGSRSW